MGWNIMNPKDLEDAIFEMKLVLAKRIGIKKGMTVVDLGCGQGGFTAALGKIVEPRGKVIAVDVSDEYLQEFNSRVDRHGVKNVVTFVQSNAADLKRVISDDTAEIVVSYRLLEELKNPRDMQRIIAEMARIIKKNGMVCLVELNLDARNEAEVVYLRLHQESGDCFFSQNQIVESMKSAGLTDVHVDIVDTSIWFSPEVARQNLGFAQVWFDEDVEKNLGRLIDKYGMKYPRLQVFRGMKRARRDLPSARLLNGACYIRVS